MKYTPRKLPDSYKKDLTEKALQLQVNELTKSTDDAMKAISDEFNKIRMNPFNQFISSLTEEEIENLIKKLK